MGAAEVSERFHGPTASTAGRLQFRLWLPCRLAGKAWRTKELVADAGGIGDDGYKLDVAA